MPAGVRASDANMPVTRIDGFEPYVNAIAEDDDRTVRIIDQRHLPHRFVIEDLTSVEQLAAAIKDMHVRGAGLIGPRTTTHYTTLHCNVL